MPARNNMCSLCAYEDIYHSSGQYCHRFHDKITPQVSTPSEEHDDGPHSHCTGFVLLEQQRSFLTGYSEKFGYRCYGGPASEFEIKS